MDRIVLISLRVALADRNDRNLPIAKQPSHSRVIAFNLIVSPFFAALPGAVEMRITPVIEFTNNTTRGLRLASHDCRGSEKARAFNNFFRKAFAALPLAMG